MLSKGFSLSVFYLQLIGEQLQGLGGDVDAWLAHRQLSRVQISEPTFVLPFPLFRQLMLDAYALSNEPALGVMIGERLMINTHGALGFAAMNCASVRQLLELLQQYIGVRIALVSLSYQEHANELVIRCEESLPLGDMQRPLYEAIALSFKNMLDFLTVGRVPIKAIHFTFSAPDYVPILQSSFKCKLHFNQAATKFILAREMLDRPLHCADPTSFEQARRICQQELNKIKQSDSLSTKVQRLLLANHYEMPSLESIAHRLHMTPRTLHRHLQTEGQSYQQLLDSVRGELALAYLSHAHMTQQQIAFALGYRDVANFRRAFKRWSGKLPSQCRVSSISELI